MPLPGFHPVVSQWFEECVGIPTAAQARGWEAIRAGRSTLIAAPTGSGKTLAAFLTAIDALVHEGASGSLPDEVRVLYVSPLKALSADIHKNLAEPRRGVRQYAERLGHAIPAITAAVRTGDTTQAERTAILRTPPHILVTTPESLYLLLTAERSRQMLRTVRTVIVDEIHAVIGTRRGAHLALSLERLAAVAERPVQRIGLSATQKPIADVAQWLVGRPEPSTPACAIVDEGHVRPRDLAIEVPKSPLEAVMAHDVWEEHYERLTQLIAAHRTTLIFVNTRRMAERMARYLSERLGEAAVTAHHGSLAKETRLDAEHRLKTGALKALVATASLELGIDIGHVDLVCQIGSPHRIATFLQRVGRSGHSIAGTPRGRLLPISRDDLVECAALLRAARRGELDRIVDHDAPLDVLAQQLAAEVSCRDCGEDDLFALVRRARPYHALSRADFDSVVTMVSEGFATRRGRRAALVHRDEVHRVLRGRRGTRMLAMTAGGAIPEVADYRVVLEPGDTFIGTINEDFAIESMAGDVFQLGNASWRVLQVAAGIVRVSDAHGTPPNIPFWLGEAPARSDELSRAVSDLRQEFEGVLTRRNRGTTDDADAGPGSSRADIEWLVSETGVSAAAAEQIAAYFTDGHTALGVIPTQQTLVLERFFDESGGMQLVLHAPFGSRINRAWALALRKRFCRQFNFELQAAASEDALLLSLGEQHSFPLADVFRYLHPASVRDILIQAFLDAPVFQTRWRWNATISLAVPRSRGGRKVPPPLQRMRADDLMAAVFPDAAACLENIPGDREIPDHPLVSQTVRDCLEEAMDLPGLLTVLEQIHRGDLRCVSRDTPEPSVFAHEILNARPYTFLDDAPLEERRAQAVQTRRASDRPDEHGILDAEAIARVRAEVRPEPRDADDLHDALLTCGFLLPDEIADTGLIDAGAATAASPARILAKAGRATRADRIWIAAERLPELLAVRPEVALDPIITAPPARAGRVWSRVEALAELLRGRLSVTGPTTAPALAEALGVSVSDVDEALLALEADGAVLRGSFTPSAAAPAGLRPDQRAADEGRDPRSGPGTLQWCDRRLLARIHRYTINRLRADIAPVSASDFQRFLFAWQHVDAVHALRGADGLRGVVAQLDGLELPARAWERDVLPARITGYEPALLDMLCLTGEVSWSRVSAGPTPVDAARSRPFDVAQGRHVGGATPIALFLREHLDAWRALRGESTDATGPLGTTAGSVLAMLRTRGASFFHDLLAGCEVDDDTLRQALGELVAAGAVSSDGFAGLRAIIGGASRHTRPEAAGRWFATTAADTQQSPADAELFAWTLLRRYGVVFRRLLQRETAGVPWRDVVRVYRRLEARGEIRGGRFVTGMSGEQFALPDAVARLREVRRTPSDDRLVTISGADPLNLTGIITAGDRIRASAGTRIVYRNGVAVAAMEGDLLRTLAPLDADDAANAAAAAARRRVPVVSGFVGRIG
jgi:ATP-dependent Lhr-like helicase